MPQHTRQAKQKNASTSSPGAAKENRMTDVAIIGGGISGLTLGVLLARGGLRVACLDRDDPAMRANPAFDGRTMAISAGSRRVLESAGLWDLLKDQACPIREIAIYDGGGPRRLTFHSDEVGGQTFGWIVDIRDLRAGLFDLAARTPGLIHLAPATVLRIDPSFSAQDNVTITLEEKGTEEAPAQIQARLVVGADGRGSFTRRDAGIGTRGWSYGQKALVCSVAHENPHENIAVEDFRPEGPFAILPMCDDADGTHRSSIVWTEHGNGPSAMAFDEKTFDVALAARFPARYGAVRRIGQRFSYPLSLLHAKTYIAPRRVLVADAAHGIHPIAGQGLNIGLRDVAALAGLVVQAHRDGRDVGGDDVLKVYERARRFDNMAMAGATDLLNHLFSNDIAPVRLARRIGLAAVARLPFAKRFFMAQAMGAGVSVPDSLSER